MAGSDQKGDHSVTVGGPRVVVFTSQSPYAALILSNYLRQFPSEISAIVTSEGGRNRRFAKRVQRVIAKAGWRYALLKLFLYGCIRLYQLVGVFPTVSSLINQHQVPHITVGAFDEDATKSKLASLNADVYFSILFDRIFPKDVLDLARLIALNLHPAPLPHYAGIAPTFWVLSNGEVSTAVTVHRIDAGIDTGEIVLQREVSIEKHETVHRLYCKCCGIAAQMIAECVDDLKSDNITLRPQRLQERSYFSSPTREGYKALRNHGHRLFSIRDLMHPS